MSETHKVAWMESQYLYPQHFQQQERYFESLVNQAIRATAVYPWGFHTLTLNTALHAESSVGLTAATGFMPDGCPFDLPSMGELPESIKIPSDTRDEVLYLALPRYKPGQTFITDAKDQGSPARYHLVSQAVFDYSQAQPSTEEIDCAGLAFSLRLEKQILGGYTCLPIAKIREVTAEGMVILEPNYIPTLLHVSPNTKLRQYLEDTIGLLHQRAGLLAQRFVDSQQSSGQSAIADFLLLQLSNRYEPQLRHLASLPVLHPERLFTTLLALAGELASFTAKSKRLDTPPLYQHQDLFGTFYPLMQLLNQQLSTVLEQTATPIPVEAKGFGIHVARVPDKSLLTQARFVLGIKADHATDFLREHVPHHLKIGSVETIRDLVNNQLSGVKPMALPVAPREITYHAGFIYYELDQTGEHWQKLRQSAGFAFHIAGEFSNLSIELWAIKK